MGMKPRKTPRCARCLELARLAARLVSILCEAKGDLCYDEVSEVQELEAHLGKLRGPHAEPGAEVRRKIEALDDEMSYLWGQINDLMDTRLEAVSDGAWRIANHRAGRSA